jgi:hypothetical protein
MSKMKYVIDHAGRKMNFVETAATKEMVVAKLEKNVARLEKKLIAARLELSEARPCYLCGKTKADGCKWDGYSCEGKAR